MEYQTITPINLTYLERITISQEYVFGPLKCEVVLRDGNQESSITAVFEDPVEIEISKISAGQGIGPLKVLDVRDRQWEDKNYKVRDYEDEFISFYCKAFSIKQQEPAALDPGMSATAPPKR
jgi:hypothetical protein